MRRRDERFAAQARRNDVPNPLHDKSDKNERTPSSTASVFRRVLSISLTSPNRDGSPPRRSEHQKFGFPTASLAGAVSMSNDEPPDEQPGAGQDRTQHGAHQPADQEHREPAIRGKREQEGERGDPQCTRDGANPEHAPSCGMSRNRLAAHGGNDGGTERNTDRERDREREVSHQAR
jgi:hypothetical protein